MTSISRVLAILPQTDENLCNMFLFMKFKFNSSRFFSLCLHRLFIISTEFLSYFEWLSSQTFLVFCCWSTMKVFKFKFFLYFAWRETFCVKRSRQKKKWEQKNASNNCIKFLRWKMEIYGVKNNWRTRKFELFFFAIFDV